MGSCRAEHQRSRILLLGEHLCVRSDLVLGSVRESLVPNFNIRAGLETISTNLSAR